MIETLHTTMEVIAGAKVEIFVFLLAACIHFLLFRHPGPSVKDVPKSKSKKVEGKKAEALRMVDGTGNESEKKNKPMHMPEPAACICHALKDALRSDGTEEVLIEDELRRLLTSHKVRKEQTQEVLAFACEGLGRLIANPELLASIRAIVGTVTSAHLAENLLRGYWSGRAYASFESFLFEFGDFCKSSGTKMTRQVIILATQFVVAAEQIEAEATQKQKEGLALMGCGGTVPSPKVLTWEKLETVMKDFLPMLDDKASLYVSFHRVLDVVVKRDRKRCWDVMENMKHQGLPPNNVTCSILLKAVQKQSEDAFLKEVMKVIETREAKDIDEVLLGSLYEACFRCGQIKEMLEYVQKLRQQGGLMKVRSAHTAGSIIRAYGAMGDIKGVWDTWNDLKQHEVAPTRITLGCMVEALASNNDPDGAYEVIQTALTDPNTKGLVNAVTYSSVLKSLNHKKRYGRVWEIYDEMIRDKVEFSTTTYNALLDVCARSGEICRAEPLLKQMADQGLVPSIITYSTVIKAYCASNQLQQAFKLFEEMKCNTDLTPDEVTFNTLLDGCARYGLYERGMQVLEEMRNMNITPSNYTLSVVAKLANRSKKPKMAFSLVEELRVKHGLKLNMHVYNNLIHAATLDADLLKAQEVFATMLGNRVQPDGRTYSLLLRFSVGQKLVAATMVILHIACGLTIQDERILSDGPLHKLLLEQLRVPVHWAKAPLSGNNGLQADVVAEGLEFLSRMQAVGLPKLRAEIRKIYPALQGV